MKLSSLLDKFESSSNRARTLSDWYDQYHLNAPRVVVQTVFDEWKRQDDETTKCFHKILETVGDIEIE